MLNLDERLVPILFFSVSLCVALQSPAQSVGVLPGRTNVELPQPVAAYVHERWGVEDGLPVNSVNAVLQTHDGYLWVGTYDGLVRFDGVRFTTFSTGNSPGLPDNSILELKETSDGSLWIRTQDHLVQLYQGRFTAFREHHLVQEDHEGNLWVGVKQGLRRYEEGRTTPFREEVLHTEVTTLTEGRAGRLWVGTREEGVIGFADGEVITLTTDDGLASNHVSDLAEDRDGTLWIGTWGGISLYREGTLTPIDLDETHWKTGPKYFYHDAVGTHWVETPHGVYRYRSGRMVPIDPENRKGLRWGWHPQVGPDGSLWFATDLRLYRNGEPVLTLGEITSMAVDREGSIWFGTRRDGLHRLKPTLFTTYSTPEGLASPNVYSIFEGRGGALWLGTMGGGLSRLKDGVFTKYGEDAGVPERLVNVVFEDGTGTLWVGNDGLCRFEKGRCVPFGREAGVWNNQAGLQHVYVLYEDRRGTIWVGAENGLHGYLAGTWVHYSTDNGLAHDFVRVIYEAGDGALWLGTRGGLIRFLPSEDEGSDRRFSSWTIAEGLSSNLVRAIYEDQDGIFWIGTEDRGLNRLDLGDTSDLHEAAVAVYTRQNGLFDDAVHQILEDDQGRLWMSTNRGIFWVQRDDLNALAEGRVRSITSFSYDERDGLRNREANGGVQGAGIKARDGRLWFPTQDGVVVVDPNEVPQNPMPPPVHIEQVLVGEETVPVRGDSVRLAPHQRDFEIAYTALSLLVPSKVRFRYRLEGYQRAWVEAEARRTAFYTNVAPGSYTFRVVAANNEGVWNEEGAALHVTVLPPWWQTPGAYALYTLLLITGIVAVDRIQRRRLIRKERAQARIREAQLKAEAAEAHARVLEELDEMKSRLFANVSHEFRTPLTLTIGPLEDLLAKKRQALPEAVAGDLGLVLRNARRLLRLTNQLLDMARLEAGRMTAHRSRLDLAAFAREIALSFAPLAEHMHITFRVETPPESVVAIFDPDQIEKVLINLLSNAFKFTPEGGAISLSVHPQPQDDRVQTVRVAVRNSGPGIPTDSLPHIFERFYQADATATRGQTGTGIGLALVKELVELNGGAVEAESEEGFSTTFTVTLPLGDEAATEAVLDTATSDAATLVHDLLAVRQAEEALAGSAEEAQEAEADVTTILVVDDHAEMRSLLRRRLESRYRIVEAADGAEALETTRRMLPDLVVSDVMMPGLDGYALCRALKQDPATDFVPVILLTARAAQEDRIEGLAAGADACLAKPFDERELEARIDNLMAARRRLQAHFGPPLEVHARPVEVLSSDEALLERLRDVVETHLSDADFGVEQIASALGVSRVHLYRQLQRLLGQSPTDLIRTMRLERAGQLLQARAGTVSEIAYGVGFKSLSHFSRRFREQYGVVPSDFATHEASDS